jgi:DNA-binding response OmpR family regulator
MSSSSPSRILIVDDSPAIVMAINFLMQDNGFETETAADGRIALAKLPVFKPDLLILDVMMPNMDGFEVAQTIRKDPNYADTRIIFLTAKGTDRDKLQGYGAGGDVYLTKPFDNQDLVELVKETLTYG